MDAKPMISDAGICWAINSLDTRDVYQPSPGINSFLADLGQDMSEPGRVANVPGTGDEFAFRLTLTMKGHVNE